MVYPVIPAGARITDELLESMLPNVVVKSVAEPVTSSTALQDDDELLAPVAANAKYDVTLHLLHDSATAGDLQFPFSAPASATMRPEERRVREGRDSTCRTRWSPYRYKQQMSTNRKKNRVTTARYRDQMSKPY